MIILLSPFPSWESLSADNGLQNRLYSSEEYSDLLISCRGNEYHVHKAIVCTQSDFFAAACRGSFKVSDSPWTSNDTHLTL